MKTIKKRKTVIFLLLSVLISFLFSGCDPNSIEYRYNIKRFIGDYETFDFYMGVRIIDYSPEGMEGEFNQNIYGITEDGYYYRDDQNEISFYEIKLDANLVKAINDTINMVGDKASLKKKEIVFEDSSMSFTYKRYYYAEGYTDDFRIEINQTSDSNLELALGASYDGYGTKSLGIGLSSYALALDDISYRYIIQIYMKKI